MTTRNAIVFTAMLFALYAAAAAVATMIFDSRDEAGAGLMPPVEAVADEDAPATIVTPASGTANASASTSPATLYDATTEGVEPSEVDEVADMPTPDLTWYDPNRLDSVAGVS